MSILRLALLEAAMARLREIVATVLSCSILTVPVWSASADALGTVVAADRASVDGTGAAVGTTIFSGDTLSTTDAGSVQLRARAARLQLSKSSMATLVDEDGTPTATLQQGSATFSTANAKGFTLIVAKAAIRAKSDEPSIGQVTLLAPKQLLVKCMRGALTVTVGDDSRVIPEGSAYRIVLDPSSEEAQTQPPPQGAGTKGTGRPPLMAARSRFIWYAVGGTAVATFFVLSEVMESPDRP